MLHRPWREACVDVQEVDRAGAQRVEALFQSSEQAVGFQQPDAGRCELDGEWQAIEAPAISATALALSSVRAKS